MVVLGVLFRKLNMHPGYEARFQARSFPQLSQKKEIYSRLERDRDCMFECHFGVLQLDIQIDFSIENLCLPLDNLRFLLYLEYPLKNYVLLVLKNHQTRPKDLESCFSFPGNGCFFASHRLFQCRDLLVLDTDKLDL